MLPGEKSILKYKNDIIEIILKYVPTAKIYLFGSRARENFHNTSDIDIAIDNKTKLEKKIIFQIKSAIDSLNVPYKIDVVDINNISEMLKKEIERDKTIWN